MRRALAAVAFVLLSPSAYAASSIALWGEPKYQPGFSHFDYANPAAPKGGTLKLSSTFAFDSLNPFLLKGVAAPNLQPYVFQSLMVQSYDEPGSYYPLLAQSIDVAPDRSSVTFVLNQAARWSDGKPVTADDVVFSFDALKGKGHPMYKILFRPVAGAQKIDARTVRFALSDKTQRELPLILAGMPVIPKHYYCLEEVARTKDGPAGGCQPFGKTTLTPPIGSGPYTIAAIDPGRSIAYTRDPHYWGAKLPTQIGLYNFDTVRFDTYRDDTVALEGLKSHQFDYYEEFIARNWATAYDVPAVKSGRLVKKLIPHKIPRGMQGFIFNTRRAKFADRRVREAIDLTLDFEWMNRALFYGAYERNGSFFNNTPFASSGLPGKDELELLAPFGSFAADIHQEDGNPGFLPAAVFTTPYAPPRTDGSGYPRANLIRAQRLLNEAGWLMKDGKRVNAQTGEALTIEFLMTQRTFQRVVGVMQTNLAKLGIDATFRYVDASQYQQRVDARQFDIVSIWWNQGLFYPATEQQSYWHSSQAEVKGSQNLAGVQSRAVDSLIGRILGAKTLPELVAAGRALDRVLLHEHFVIPHWNINAWRVAYWDIFDRPKITPAYNLCLDCWWAKEVTRDPRPATRKKNGPAGDSRLKTGDSP